MSELKAFEDVVHFSESGQVHNMIVVAVKAGGLIDGVFCKRLFAADGKTPLNVVGSSRQAELVQFRHDVKPGEYSVPGDFYFSLNDEQAEALDDERRRRQHEKQQADQAVLSAEAEKALLDGVVIRPSDRVIEKAKELWLEQLQADGHVDQHSDVAFPKYEQKAKVQLAKSEPEQPADPKTEEPGGDKGPARQLGADCAPAMAE